LVPLERLRTVTACSRSSPSPHHLDLDAEGFLRHVEDSVFPEGCFFASVAAEMDTHPGPVRDRAVEVVGDWMQQLVDAVRQAQDEGAIDSSEDAEQLAF
jgi:Tetracyclin repressor-like, C-terminal domain